MACCGDASTWAKIGFLCMLTSFGLQSAAFLTNYWMVYKTVLSSTDIHVGLFWLTNCSSACYTATTPGTFSDHLFFKLTMILEAVTVGLFFIIGVIYSFYVLADRSRTRATAISIIILLSLTELFPISGIVLWILQVEKPYFLAWSAGMSLIATGFAFFSMLCLIPDLKEYPFYQKMIVNPADKHFYDMQFNKYENTQKKNPTEKVDLKDHKRKKHLKDPYSMKDSYMDDDIDRQIFMMTPSKPPRYDTLPYNVKF